MWFSLEIPISRGGRVCKYATQGCCSTADCCMVDRASTSMEASTSGSVRASTSSHPPSTFIHMFGKTFQVAGSGPVCSPTAQKDHAKDHAALMAVQRTNPRGVVSETSGVAHTMVHTSVSGPSGVSAGPMHCSADPGEGGVQHPIQSQACLGGASGGGGGQVSLSTTLPYPRFTALL